MTASDTVYESDLHLVSAIRSGSRGAFRQLYSRFAPMVMGIIRHSVSDDNIAEKALQHTFLALWDNRACATPQSLVPWVLTTARTTLRKHPGNFTLSNRDTSASGEAALLETAWFSGSGLDELSLEFKIRKDDIKTMLRNAVNKYKKTGND